MEFLTADDMRAIEMEAIESGRVTGRELMERAGQGVVDALFQQWPELEQGDRRVAVLCGPGNNGGDGFVVARLLQERGWDVEVFLYGDPGKLPTDARHNHDRYDAVGGKVLPLAQLCDRDMKLEPTRDLWIDALFGIGLSRPLPSEVRTVLARVTAERGRRNFRIVAIDIPSGIDSDTGARIEPPNEKTLVWAADLTVTFHRPKAGHAEGDGAAATGLLVVKDIGL